MFFTFYFFRVHYLSSLLALIALMLIKVSYAVALDEERLWLPSNYEHLYLNLKNSAITVEALESCETVLRGTLDFDVSVLPDHPVFRILCRRPNGRTYNEMVTPRKVWTESEVEENKVNQANALLLIQHDMQVACDMRLTEETELFSILLRKQTLFSLIKFDYSNFSDDVVVLNPRGVFQMDFDAMDMYNVQLEYRALCYIDSDGITEMAIKKRKEDGMVKEGISKESTGENIMN